MADDMKYEGPFGTRVGAGAYLKEIERLRLKFHIQRIFTHPEDVCVGPSQLDQVPVNVLMKAREVSYVLEHSKGVMCFARPDVAQVAMEAGRSCALREA